MTEAQQPDMWDSLRDFVTDILRTCHYEELAERGGTVQLKSWAFERIARRYFPEVWSGQTLLLSEEEQQQARLAAGRERLPKKSNADAST